MFTVGVQAYMRLSWKLCTCGCIGMCACSANRHENLWVSLAELIRAAMVLTLESFDKLHCIKLTRNGPCASSNQGLYGENSPQNLNSLMINLLICSFNPARQIFFYVECRKRISEETSCSSFLYIYSLSSDQNSNKDHNKTLGMHQYSNYAKYDKLPNIICMFAI